MLFSKDRIDDDDEFNIAPNSQSNLASLFGYSGSSGNTSLTYTAPKQPKRLNKPVSGGHQSTSSSSPTVIIAKAVHTFKMVDKKYQSQGKLGAALLGGRSAEDGPYQLLLYRGKQQQVCVSRISRDTNFIVQPKNYCTFYDSQGAVWSILFDNVLEMTEFTFHVALAKWKSGDSKSPIMFQDLWCPNCEEPKPCVAAVGDNVELAYTLQPSPSITSGSQGLEELQNVFVKVEESGWTQGLVGMQPTAKRAIFLQPFMLGDLNPKERFYNSPVVLKLTMINISKEQGKPLTKEENKDSIKNLPNVNSEPELEEAPVNNSSPKTTKADLITRMARMGQALPFKTVTPSISDSDETEDDHNMERVVPKPRTRVQHSAALSSPPVNTVVAAAPSLPTSVALAQHPVPVQWASASYMGGSMYPVQQMQSPSELQNQAQFNMFFSEVRTSNSELRMGITRLTDKVEALQTKFDFNLDKKPTQDVSSVLERLLENEQQLKDQLRCVITALNNSQQSCSQHRPSGESSISSTVKSTQCCMEKDHTHNCNNLTTPTHGEIERTSGNEPRLKKDLSAEKIALDSSEYSSRESRASREVAADLSVENCIQCKEKDEACAVLCEKIKKLEEENSLKDATNSDHDQQALIDDLKNQVKVKQDEADKALEQLSNLTTEKKHLSQELEKAKCIVKELENRLQEKQMCIDKLEQTVMGNDVVNNKEITRNLQEVFNPKPVIGDHIKKILNAVYRLVKLQFKPANTYDTPFIQSVLAETIKAVTLEYLENENLSIAEEKPSLSKNMQVGQTQSAPVCTSEQKNDDRNSKEFMNEDQHDSVKLSTSAFAEMSSASKSSTPQEASANDSGGNKSPNAVKSNPSSSDFEAHSIKQPVEINSSVANSAEESSDDIWQQPPPVPLFDEDENDDDWINS